MLMKLGAAGVLFGVYYTAPFLLGGVHAQKENPDSEHDPADCHGNPDPLTQKAPAALHIFAFAAGVGAAVLDVSLGTQMKAAPSF